MSPRVQKVVPRTTGPATGGRGLLGLGGLSREEIRALLERAGELGRAGQRGEQPLRGRVVANLFFEDSTRTKTSFAIAGRRLGAEVVDLSSGSSSVNKGETLIDTARTVEAMGVGAIVVRARQSGAAAIIQAGVGVPVINAGDGRHEHPTQGLLDLYTIAGAHGREDFDLSGLTVAIVGDVANSRVARSDIAGLGALGARTICVGPPALAPKGLESLGAKVSHDLDAVLPKADVVVMLRIQFERHGAPGGGGEGGEKSGEKKSAAIASIREYRAFYALTGERAARLKKGAVVMHPGPMNRGIEIDADVADGPRAVITRQVAHGVLVRMAALERALGRGA